MSLTKVDCYFFRGPRASGDHSSYLAFSPGKAPGTIIIAGASAARGSIGSQVACKLSLEHFLEGVLNFFDEHPVQFSSGNKYVKAPSTQSEASLKILEAAFKNANNSVYSFGHRLAAGGRLGTSLIGMVVHEQMISIGRVGAGSAYLLREGELFPFFEAVASAPAAESYEKLVGAKSLVSVELASVPVAANDLILVCSMALTVADERQLSTAVSDFVVDPENLNSESLENLAKFLFEETGDFPFLIAAHLGPETVYLNQRVK